MMAHLVKNLPAVQETQVWFLGQEDPLEKETATHFSILAWEIPWTVEPGSLQSKGLQKVGHDWVTKQTHMEYRKNFYVYFTNEELRLKKNWTKDT